MMASRDSSPNDFAVDHNPKRKPQLHQGRSSREVDEELIKLRNENFNLKLRLHFKDRVGEGSVRASGSSDAVCRELEDAKIVIHALRLEIAEKTQLLKDAAVAISEHEEREKEFVLESQAKIAELEGYITHLQDEKPLEALFAQDLKRMEEKQVARQIDDLHKAKKQIEHLKHELSERDREKASSDDKLMEITRENSELVSLLQEHYKFGVIANQMMELQKKELDECLAEKLGFINRLNEILPELSSQNDLLKEATMTVQELLETTDLKANLSRELLENYKAAITESKIEIHNITDDIMKWTSNCRSGNRAGSDSNSAKIKSDISDNDLSMQSTEFSVTMALPQPEAASLPPGKAQDGSGKHLRGHGKSSFTGLRQFVKCWGRQYSKSPATNAASRSLLSHAIGSPFPRLLSTTN
ncbi:centrosomin-like isoform X3 [Drosophila hydei]|uniref:Centrosomin-like isoform X3 n=1 Tax=Drosophila hydei TaxID=7224 RepID=A0A6J1MB07_DROHY|nr:centrosomin-like isoform X3 [Drosophila hydei]